MKNVVLAITLCLAGAALAHMHVLTQRYQPMVAIAAPEGVTYVAVQDPTARRQACGDANNRFLQPVKAGCKDCKVIAARCERVVDADDARALSEAPVPQYLVVAPGLRLTISGPDGSAKASCEYIAGDMVKRGLRRAACIPPRSASAT